jgi:chlorobactene glucosyltransferase
MREADIFADRRSIRSRANTLFLPLSERLCANIAAVVPSPETTSNIWLILLALLAAGGCAGGIAYWAVVLWRVRRMMPQVPAVEAGVASAPTNSARVSVIVPAHNEERVIADCAKALRSQDHADLEIVFVLDRCSDRTLERLRAAVGDDPRVRIVENDHCPDEWAGKCHAAWIGAKVATGDWLLFSDADVEFAPQLVRASLATAIARGCGLLSLVGRLDSGAWFERVLQPAAAFGLLRIFPLDRANRTEAPRAFANGQFMLFSRSLYESIGGHASVRDDLLEDLAFARLARMRGGRIGVATAKDLMGVSMYPSFDAMRRGWRRIFIEACHRSPARLRRYAMRAAGSALLPVAIVAALALSAHAAGRGEWPQAVALAALGVAATAMQSLALAAIYRSMAMPRSAMPWFPLGSLILANELRRGARDLEQRKPVRWGGRSYVLEPNVHTPAIRGEIVPFVEDGVGTSPSSIRSENLPTS